MARSAIRSARRLEASEAQIKLAVTQYLDARKIFYLRLNSGAQTIDGPKGRRFVRMCPAGTPDILALAPTAVVRYNEWSDGGGELLGRYKVRPLPSGFNEIRRPLPLWIELKTERGKQTPAQIRFQQLAEARREGYIIARCIEDVARALEEA